MSTNTGARSAQNVRSDSIPPYPVDALLILGPTGVGKSPLGNIIALRGLLGRRCHHLDFGAELRRAVSGGETSRCYSPDERDFIVGVLERGLLLENEYFVLAEKIISLFLKRVGFSKADVLLLNGMPRHQGQARDVARIAQVHAVIVLDCSADDVLCRIASNVGGDRTERVDDTVEMIAHKLTVYRERTSPLIEHYEQQGARIYRTGVHASMTPSEAYTLVSALAAADPPISLVAEPPQR